MGSVTGLVPSPRGLMIGRRLVNVSITEEGAVRIGQAVEKS